jgi:TldD protein
MSEGDPKEQLERVRDEALRRSVEFAEARYVAIRHSGLMLQDGRADRVGAGKRAGMGLRVVVDGAWGFASTESADVGDWLSCVADAADMAKVSAQRREERVVLAEAPAIIDEVKASFEIEPTGVPLERKLAAVRGYEEASARIAGGATANLMTGYNDSHQVEVVCNTRGTLVSSESVRTMVWHAITTQDGALRQRGRQYRGRQAGFEVVEETPAEKLSVKAAERAVSLLSARPAPAGKFPAV